MTNGIYFYDTIREEWSASTSPNDTPRPSFVDTGGAPTILVEEASSSSFSSTSGAIGGGGSSISQTQIHSVDGGKLGSSNLKKFSFEELKAATRRSRGGGLSRNIIVEGGSSISQPSDGRKLGTSTLKSFSFRELKAAIRKSRRGGVSFNIVVGGGSSISHTQIPFGDRGKSNLKYFSFKELKAATSNFGHDVVLGEGGFGRVYKGWIDEDTLTATEPGKGIAVAVKRLSKYSFQGRKEWLAEVNYLGQLYHPNLVCLLGYCFDNEEYLLAYEFMPRGSLGNHLSRMSSSGPLSWRLRMKVALGAAKGLAFLHTAQINVIHRGVKSSNILLDSDYNPKLSDFGLARDGPTGDMTHVSTMVKGTLGFIAPEYLTTGHLNSKSDVYSFGAVLVEILTGGRLHDCFFGYEELNLEEWVKSYLMHKEKISCVLDSHLNGQYALQDALKVVTLAYHCLSSDPNCRPNMNEVAIALEELQNSEYK